MSAAPVSSTVTPRPSRKRSAPRRDGDGDDDSSSDDDVIGLPNAPGLRAVSTDNYERLRRQHATALQNAAVLQGEKKALMDLLRQSTEAGVQLAVRAALLAEQESRLETRAFRAERALSATFAAMLSARGVSCGANCGCDPLKEPLLKLSNCTHYVCTSFITGTVLHMRTTLAIGSGVGPLELSCPQCRVVGKPNVDKSVLPLQDCNLDDSNDGALVDVPSEVHRMYNFVRDGARGDVARPLFLTIAARANIDTSPSDEASPAPVVDLTQEQSAHTAF